MKLAKERLKTPSKGYEGEEKLDYTLIQTKTHLYIPRKTYIPIYPLHQPPTPYSQVKTNRQSV